MADHSNLKASFVDGRKQPMNGRGDHVGGREEQFAPSKGTGQESKLMGEGREEVQAGGRQQ